MRSNSHKSQILFYGLQNQPMYGFMRFEQIKARVPKANRCKHSRKHLQPLRPHADLPRLFNREFNLEDAWLSSSAPLPIPDGPYVAKVCENLCRQFEDDCMVLGGESAAEARRWREAIDFYSKINSWSEVQWQQAYQALLFIGERDLLFGMLIRGKYDPRAYNAFAERSIEDLRRLASVCDQNSEAATALASIAITATQLLNTLASKHTHIFKNAIRSIDRWPYLWARASVLTEKSDELKSLLAHELGKDYPYRADEKLRGKRNGTISRLCLYTANHIEHLRRCLNEKRFLRLAPLPTWAKGIRKLDDLTDQTWKDWFKIAEKLLNHFCPDIENHPEIKRGFRTPTGSIRRKRFREKFRRNFKALAPLS